MPPDSASPITLARHALNAGDPTSARRLALSALSDEPANGAALWVLGEICLALGDIAQAVRWMVRTSLVSHLSDDGRRDLAERLFRAGFVEAAIAVLMPLRRLGASSHEDIAFLGHAAASLGRVGEAVRLFRDALILEPANATTWREVSKGCSAMADVSGAVTAAGRAVRCAPDDLDACRQLASAFREAGDGNAALACFRAALSLSPADVDILNDLGRAMPWAEADTAVIWFTRAILLRPDLAPLRFNRARLLLARGRWRDGWDDYRARGTMAPGVPFRSRPIESDLSGQTLYLVRDQGLGDELFFLRFAPELRARGARLVYCAGAKLIPLLERTGLFSQVVDLIRTAEPVISIGDLPCLLRSDATPPPLPLRPLEGRELAWSEHLAALGPPPHVGVTWKAGSLVGANRLIKRLAPENLGQALRPLPGTIIVLQRNLDHRELEALSSAAGRACHVVDADDDLDDALALQAALDAYVAVSNTNVHLRAGLGLGSHVVVCQPEFRWMTTEDRSPWFPDCHVYRMDGRSSERDVLDTLGRDLMRAVERPE